MVLYFLDFPSDCHASTWASKTRIIACFGNAKLVLINHWVMIGYDMLNQLWAAASLVMGLRNLPYNSALCCGGCQPQQLRDHEDDIWASVSPVSQVKRKTSSTALLRQKLITSFFRRYCIHGSDICDCLYRGLAWRGCQSLIDIDFICQKRQGCTEIGISCFERSDRSHYLPKSITKVFIRHTSHQPIP